jgi:hypothetical protein
VIEAARNLGAKALRRLGSVHKPLVRMGRRHTRSREQAQMAADAAAVEREIADVARGHAPIVAGPWLAEVGYEALYWVPFLRWFQDAYRIPPDRITVVSRGGVDHWYRGIAAHYVDIFDHLSPADLVAANDARQHREEGGGRKQSAPGSLDERILATTHAGATSVLHPSLLFRLFRHVWHGNLPLDLFWTRTRYELMERPPRPALPGLPSEYIAAKFYTGTALPDTPATRAQVRAIVQQAAASMPVVVLETGVALDEHGDYLFSGIPNVISARTWMTPRTNLAVQTALIAHSQFFLGTCGGLAWLAPFLGVPAVAVYADDRQLAPHLLTARQAGRRCGAADLSLLDLRALGRVGFIG